MQPKTKLLQALRANLRLRHFSRRTEEPYVGWVRRFVRFHGLGHPRELGEREVLGFLAHLRLERGSRPQRRSAALRGAGEAEAVRRHIRVSLRSISLGAWQLDGEAAR